MVEGVSDDADETENVKLSNGKGRGWAHASFDPQSKIKMYFMLSNGTTWYHKSGYQVSSEGSDKVVCGDDYCAGSEKGQNLYVPVYLWVFGLLKLII